MGNVCATKQPVSDTEEITEVSIADVDDIMFQDYLDGKHELVDNMTTRGSSFLSKTKLQIEIPPFSDRLPPLCTRNSGDHLFFGEESPSGFRIQSPQPMPLCFRRHKTPPGSPRCFDSDCRSQFSDSSSVSDSSIFESSIQSTPRQSPDFLERYTSNSMTSDGDEIGRGKQEFDKSVWIWPADHKSSRIPPKLKVVQQLPSPKHPQCTPLVYTKSSVSWWNTYQKTT